MLTENTLRTVGGSRQFTPKCNTKQSVTECSPLCSFRHATMSYCAERSDFLFRRLHRIKNEGVCMSEERLLFEIERLLLDSVQVLGLVKDDPAMLDFLFNLVSDMGNSRLGVPVHKNVHRAVECAEHSNYQQILENMIRPAMYSLNTECSEGAEAAVFIYRCFNAASAIAMYDCHRVPVYDFRFAVDTARKARDVVGEWLDF